MRRQTNRYDQMAQYMTYTLIGNALLFIAFLFASGYGIIWLKVILFILTFILSLLCLAFLYLTKELLRPRSLWMTTAAAAIALCVLFSLILNFPSPSPYSQKNDKPQSSYTENS